MSNPQLQHSPSTSSSEDQLCPTRSKTPISHLSTLGGLGCIVLSSFSPFRVNKGMEIQFPFHLSPNLPPSDWPPPCTHWISIHHSLKVQLRTRTIMPLNIAQSCLRCASPNSLNHLLKIGTVIASKCISGLPRLQPSSQPLDSYNLCLQVHLQMCSMIASKLLYEFSQLVSVNAPLTILKYHLQPEWPYLCILWDFDR